MRSERDLHLTSDLDLPRYWRLFKVRHPGEARRSTMQKRRICQRPLPDLGIVVTLDMSEAKGHVSVFLGLNTRAGTNRTRLAPVADGVRERLEEQPYTPAPFGHHGSTWPVDLRDEHNWPAIADWLVTEANRLKDAARRALGFQTRCSQGSQFVTCAAGFRSHRRAGRDQEPRLREGRGCRSIPNALRCHAASGAWAWS